MHKYMLKMIRKISALSLAFPFSLLYLKLLLNNCQWLQSVLQFINNKYVTSPLNTMLHDISFSQSFVICFLCYSNQRKVVHIVTYIKL